MSSSSPASAGTGVIAGGPVRAVLECAGIHDVLSKSLGSDNPINIVHATVAALKGLSRPEEIAARRGLPIEDVAPAADAEGSARRHRGGRSGEGGELVDGTPEDHSGSLEDRWQAEPA